MSIKRVKITDIPENKELLSRGFMMYKSCGQGIVSFVVSLILNWIDQLIISQNTEYNNYHFFVSIAGSLQFNEPLFSFLQEIYNKSADINKFTTSCLTPEMYECLYNLGYNLLGINENSNVSEIRKKQEEFSEKLNVQIHIYSPSNSQPIKIEKNRFTDALILSLYNKDNGYSALYHKNFSVLSEENFNCTKYFHPDTELPQSIPEHAIQLISDEMKDIIIQQKYVDQLSSAYSTLINSVGQIPSLYSAISNLISRNDNPCIKCKNLKVIHTLYCGCSLCKYCLILCNSHHTCYFCNQVLMPLDIQLINSYY